MLGMWIRVCNYRDMLEAYHLICQSRLKGAKTGQTGVCVTSIFNLTQIFFFIH